MESLLKIFSKNRHRIQDYSEPKVSEEIGRNSNRQTTQIQDETPQQKPLPSLHLHQKSKKPSFIYSNRSVNSNFDASDDNVTYMKCILHDFRGPINNIVLATNVLEEMVDLKHNDIIKNIQESCDFMTHSLNGFLKIKSNEHKKIIILKNPFNIIGTIKKIQFLLLYSLQEKEIGFSFHYDDTMDEWVFGDEHNLQHALLNIINNAIKFSKNGSSISVVISYEKTANTQQLIVIRIIDENDWIPQHIKDRLFEKYVTSDNIIGTGLGLYITKKIIMMHDGEIAHFYGGGGGVGEKRGNIFEIKLPLPICHQNFSIRKSSYGSNSYGSNSLHSQIDFNIQEGGEKLVDRQDTPISDLSINNHQKINIVVCDDSVISRKMMVKLIESACINMKLKNKIYQILDGLQAITELHNKLDKISIIFIDNVMPNVSGPLAVKIIRALGYDNLVIGITGNSVESDIKEFYGCGANYVFIKPFHKASLQMVLDLYSEHGAKQKQGMVLKVVKKRLEWVAVKPPSPI